MANNNLIKVALPDPIDNTYPNTYTDDQLKGSVDELNSDKNIIAESVAYTKTLNALFRQVTAITHTLADLIANNQSDDVTSEVDVSMLTNALNKLTETFITANGNRDKVVLGGASTNVSVVAEGRMPVRTNTNEWKMKDLNTLVPTARKLANLDLTVDRSRDALIGINGTDYGKPIVKTAPDTYEVSDDYTFTEDLPFIKDPSDPAPQQLKVRIMSQADWNALTSKDANTFYILT